MFEEGFKWWNLGSGAAVAFILFLCIFAVTLVQMKVARRAGRYDARRCSALDRLFAALVALLCSMPLAVDGVGQLHGAGRRRRNSRRRCSPTNPTLENYRTLFGTYGIGRYFVNSLLVSTLAPRSRLLFVVPAGYAFAKLRFTGRDGCSRRWSRRWSCPGQIGMLPLFLELKAMGLVNSYAGALVPWLAGIFGIFLVRQFCLSIPTEMLEAARVDGASEALILRKIVLPALTPMLVTLALFVFLGSWNDFMWPLIILADQDLYTLPVALAALSREHVQDNELMMAGRW